MGKLRHRIPSAHMGAGQSREMAPSSQPAHESRVWLNKASCETQTRAGPWRRGCGRQPGLTHAKILLAWLKNPLPSGEGLAWDCPDLCWWPVSLRSAGLWPLGISKKHSEGSWVPACLCRGTPLHWGVLGAGSQPLRGWGPLPTQTAPGEGRSSPKQAVGPSATDCVYPALPSVLLGIPKRGGLCPKTVAGGEQWELLPPPACHPASSAGSVSCSPQVLKACHGGRREGVGVTPPPSAVLLSLGGDSAAWPAAVACAGSEGYGDTGSRGRATWRCPFPRLSLRAGSWARSCRQVGTAAAVSPSPPMPVFPGAVTLGSWWPGGQPWAGSGGVFWLPMAFSSSNHLPLLCLLGGPITSVRPAAVGRRSTASSTPSCR